MLTQYCFIVVPSSSTLGQHQTTLGELDRTILERQSQQTRFIEPMLA